MMHAGQRLYRRRKPCSAGRVDMHVDCAAHASWHAWVITDRPDQGRRHLASRAATLSVQTAEHISR